MASMTTRPVSGLMMRARRLLIPQSMTTSFKGPVKLACDAGGGAGTFYPWPAPPPINREPALDALPFGPPHQRRIGEIHGQVAVLRHQLAHPRQVVHVEA